MIFSFTTTSTTKSLGILFSKKEGNLKQKLDEREHRNSD